MEIGEKVNEGEILEKCIGLLRGINVSGQNRILMADLRLLCQQLGWSSVQTYIQSGNVVFGGASSPTSAAAALEQALEPRFGFRVPVIVRSAADWQRYIESNPFSDAGNTEANLVMLALSKATPSVDALQGLRSRAVGGELVEQVGDAIWIHYKSGVGKSKISPELLDRLVGAPVTTRNWNTVMKLGQLALEISANDAGSAKPFAQPASPSADGLA